LVSPEWIKSVSWAGAYVDLSLDRKAIKDAPVYNEDAPFDRDEEREVYGHYGRKMYWHDKPVGTLA
jgi:hypothetical protein